MVSHGFEAVEDFYSKSSTRSMVGNVKIPVLFIQVNGLLFVYVFTPSSGKFSWKNVL